MKARTDLCKKIISDLIHHARFANDHAAKELLKIIRSGKVCEYMVTTSCGYVTTHKALQHLKGWSRRVSKGKR